MDLQGFDTFEAARALKSVCMETEHAVESTSIEARILGTCQR